MRVAGPPFRVSGELEPDRAGNGGRVSVAPEPDASSSQPGIADLFHADEVARLVRPPDCQRTVVKGHVAGPSTSAGTQLAVSADRDVYSRFGCNVWRGV